MTTIPFKLLTPTAKQPTRATTGSTCYDIYADIMADVIVPARGHAIIPTNVALQLPSGWEAQVRPRSGMALKSGVVALFGSIDSDYTGGIGVVLFNHSDQPYCVLPDQRIAQLAFAQVPVTKLVSTDTLIHSSRGASGFGHTGA